MKKRFALTSTLSVCNSIAFASNRLSAILRKRKQEPSQMQLAFERARAKVA